jgi:hypothetical protein
MTRHNRYKKHMKRVTDLFWTPNDGTGLHLTFDQQYHVTVRRDFDSSESQDVLRRAFETGGREPPIPVFESTGGSADSEGTAGIEPREVAELQSRHGAF